MTILEKVKMIRIVDYAQSCGFTLKRIGKYYTLKEHDSVRIDDERNCFWRNSTFQRGIKGHSGTVIDFAMEFENYATAREAIYAIADKYCLSSDNDFISPKAKHIPKSNATLNKSYSSNAHIFSLPISISNTDDVVSYLCNVRKLDYDLVNTFIQRGLLYQDTRRNCVFVSPDKTFACLRSTGEKKFVRDVEGSNYDNCFFLLDDGITIPHSIVVTESVIDMMSVMTYIRRYPMYLAKYSDKAFLALSGTNKIQSLFVHLKNYPSISAVVFALDNDNAGHSAVTKAVDTLVDTGFKGTIFFAYPPDYKDWNECIVNTMINK